MDEDPLDRPFPISGYESLRYGAVVTLENQAGKVLILHRAGRVRAAVEEAFRVAAGLDPTFRVRCVSTPQTIYTDLQGARHALGDSKPGQGSHALQLPEHGLCGGRLRAILHPSLRGSSDRSRLWRAVDAQQGHHGEPV